MDADALSILDSQTRHGSSDSSMVRSSGSQVKYRCSFTSSGLSIRQGNIEAPKPCWDTLSRLLNSGVPISRVG